MYGSLISDGREFHDTLNQPLTSDAIHEAIFGEHVVDQFDVEPLEVLSGSTYDSIIFGTGSLLNHAGTEGVRGKKASLAQHGGGTSGSFSRNIVYTNNLLRYSDSLVAPIWWFLSNGKFFPELTGTIAGVSLNVGQPALPTNYSNALVLSSNPVSQSFGLLRFLGLHDQQTFVSNISKDPSSNFLESPGGVVTSANRLVFDLSR